MKQMPGTYGSTLPFGQRGGDSFASLLDQCRQVVLAVGSGHHRLMDRKDDTPGTRQLTTAR